MLVLALMAITVATAVGVAKVTNGSGDSNFLANALAELSSGVLHVTQGTGEITSSSIIASDIARGAITNDTISAVAAIADSKLATLTSPGKVANIATTATSQNLPDTIVVRNSSGDFVASTITGNLVGNATTATALAINPADCAASSFATGIAANGDLTCTAISIPTATTTGGADASMLTGATLASGVTASSLTSLGTLSSLTMDGSLDLANHSILQGATITASSFVGSLTGNATTVTNGVYTTGADVVYLTPTGNGSGLTGISVNANALTGTTLASGVTASSLTSLGTLSSLTVAPTSRSGAAPALFTLTTPSDTALTAGAESIAVNVNTSATRTFATGALTTQRESLFQAPTYAFAAASTITNAATIAISGAPIAGANATITNPYALWVQGGKSQFDGPVTFAGTTIATTQSAGDNSTKLATTAYVDARDASLPWLIDVPIVLGQVDSVGFNALYVGGTLLTWNGTGTTAGAGSVGDDRMVNNIAFGNDNGAPAQNDYVTYNVTLAAGTWNIRMLYYAINNGGIATFQLDGVTVGNPIDTNNGGGTGHRDRYGETGTFTVSSTGKKTLKIVMATSTSGAYAMMMHQLVLVRTN